MITLFDSLISTFNAWPPEGMAVIEIVLCLFFMMSLLRFYGIAGLYSYIIVVLIVANIQVLKGGQFIFPSHPIAMGTLLFGTLGLAFDLMTEYYGKAMALKGVRLGFFILCFFTLLMLITIGVRPPHPTSLSQDAISLYQNHLHMKALFTPIPSILIASLVSYLASQYVDVVIFWIIRRLTKAHWLGLRALVSMSIAAFIDTCLFSVLAWKLLSSTPVSWETLISVYILGTYPLRLLSSFCLSPFIYLGRYFLPKSNNEHVSAF